MTELPSGVKLGTANLEKIDWYWQKIKDFDRLFSDDIRWDEECFFEKMYAPDTVFFETENGLLLLTGLKEGMYAAAHITFWDHKLLPRVKMIKDFSLTGTGIGTFEYVFPKYRTRDIRFIFVWIEITYFLS